MRVPFAATALGIALGESVLAGAASVREGLDLVETCAAAIGAGVVALALAWPALWCLDTLLRTRGARALERGLHNAFAAGGSVALATVAVSASFAGSMAVAFALSPAWSTRMSPRFALLASLFSMCTSLGLGLVACAGLGHRIGARLAPKHARALALDRALAAWLPGGGLIAAIAALAGPRHALTPGLAALALGVALATGLRARALRLGAPLVLVACAGGVAGLDFAPPASAGMILYRTPYAGLAIGVAQRAFDADRDGAARWFLGGDCDDGDARVHPRAREFPGNGVDENCSGDDAPRFHPRRAPAIARPASLTEPHDVVLVFIDALRPDHLSLAGYPRKTTPEIDRLAREGTWFRRAYTTAPSTRFAMASLLTGRDVRRLRHQDLGGNNFALHSGAPTIARALRSAGYQTVGYTVSYVAQHNMGTGQGFQTWKTPWPVHEWARTRDRNAELTTDAALQTLANTAPDQRLFLFVHYDCPHDPYRKHAKWDFGSRDVDLYDSAVAYCDDQFGRLMTTLRARPNWDRTSVFVVSDHGELFGEHGLSNHGNSLYEPDVRVVMVARVPGTRPSVVDAPVQLHDVAPTVLELAGVAPDPGHDAWSLTGKLFGLEPATPRPLFLFTELERGSVRYDASAVIHWPHKLVRDRRTRSVTLYDIAKDPDERSSLARTRVDVAGRLSDLLDGYEGWAVP